jgi:VCBS repeat-containing protein
MALRLQRVLKGQLGKWSAGRIVAVISTCVLLGLASDGQRGWAQAQNSTTHPPIITTNQWSLGVPVIVSANASGVAGDGTSLHANFSPDSTHVLFYSNATNLVPGATNGQQQVYIKDLITGVVQLVSADANGKEANGMSAAPNNSVQVRMFSPDGTKVVFESNAMNLVPNGTDGTMEIFLKDLTTGAVTLVSADVNGNQADFGSTDFSFSPDGTKVVFDSSADNLVPGGSRGQQIFIKDLTTQAVTLVSADGNGIMSNGVSGWPVFSPDGNAVAFFSSASNLVPGGTASQQIFRKDLVTQAVTLVSADANGNMGDGESRWAMFSPDGGKVAFNSISTNFVAGATTVDQVYVKDLASGAITLVSADATGAVANSSSQLAMFSADGAKIAFHSGATNLVQGTSSEQVFVKDLVTGAVMLALTDANGAPVSGFSDDPNFSADHLALAFESDAGSVGVPSGTVQIILRPIFTPTGAVVDSPSAITLTTAGQLSFSDLDGDDTHTASVAAQGGDLGMLTATVSQDSTGTGSGVINWNYQVDEGQVRALSANAADAFTVTLTDSQGCTATVAMVVTALPRDFSVVNANSGNVSTSNTTSSCITDTTTALSSSQNPSVFGQAVTFTATVSPVRAVGATPTGTVTFLDGGSAIGSGTVSGGMATLTTSVLAVGNHTVTVSYGGDGNFNGSVGSLSGNPQIVTPASTAVVVSSSQNASVFGQAVTFTATVSAIAPGAGTPTGTVTFLDGDGVMGTRTLSAGMGSFTTSALAVGSHPITVSYGGDGNFNGNSGSLGGSAQIVAKASTTTTVSTSQNASVFGQAVTFTATVSAMAPGAGTPTGTATFLDGDGAIGSATLNGGVATFTTSALAVASHTVTVNYGGDGNFNGGSGSLSGNPQVVTKASTVTTVSSSQNPSVWGQAVTFTATVSAMAPGAGLPTGTVTFLDGSSAIGTATLSGGTASFTSSALAVTNHGISASYGGDGNFNGGSGSLSGNPQVVGKASTATAVSSSQNVSVLGQTVTFTATVAPLAPGAGAPTGTVTFSDGATLLATVALSSTGTATSSTSALAVKGHTITAVYSGDGNFNGSSGSVTQTVGYSICVLYDQTRTVHGGATYPIKLALCDANGADISSSAIVLHATAIMMLSNFVGTPDSPGNANPDNDFRFDSTLGASGGYIYNLSTAGLDAGTYSLQFTAGADPLPHSVAFGVHR